MVLKSSGVAAEIIGIAVSDNARHKGIGKELIQSVERRILSGAGDTVFEDIAV